MSYSTARYGRQSVSNDESLVSYVQNPRFDVSDSDAESYLGPYEGTYSDHDEATYSDHDEATYLDHDEATYSDYDEATYSDHDEATYSDHDEETDSIDSGQDDPRCYGVCPGKFAPDAISNDDYRCGNDNFDYFKRWWPDTIPRHYTWEGEYPTDERNALVRVQEEIDIELKKMPRHGQWVPYTFIYRQLVMPYIATITYSDSNAPVTLSYALVREPGSEVSVVGVKVHPALRDAITVVSRWRVVGAGKRDTNKNTEGILGFAIPPTPREEGTELEWSAGLCEWWIPEHSLRDTLNFPRDEVVKRPNYRSSRGTGHRHRVRR